MSKQIKELALALVKGQHTAEFSIADMENALRAEFAKIVTDHKSFRENKNVVFSIMEESLDEVLPKRVLDAIGMFADVKQVAQGDKIRFKVKKGRLGVRNFVTKVANAGVYERVRLDKTAFELTSFALGGAVYVDFEQFLDGHIDFAELTALFAQGIEDSILVEVQKALMNTFSILPTANKYTNAGFSGPNLTKALNVVRAYGVPTIYCTPNFAASIQNDAGYISDADKADIRDMGYIGKFKGANVVVMPQSFTDTTNATKIFDDQYAFIIPSGSDVDARPVKVAFEGETQMRDVQNADWSMELQAYKKVGIGVINTNHYAMIRDTSL